MLGQAKVLPIIAIDVMSHELVLWNWTNYQKISIWSLNQRQNCPSKAKPSYNEVRETASYHRRCSGLDACGKPGPFGTQGPRRSSKYSLAFQVCPNLTHRTSPWRPDTIVVWLTQRPQVHWTARTLSPEKVCGTSKWDPSSPRPFSSICQERNGASETNLAQSWGNRQCSAAVPPI